MTNKTKNRLNRLEQKFITKYKDEMYNDIIETVIPNMSFYDFIRIYPKSDINNIQIEKIPIEYINDNPLYPWNFQDIAKRITCAEYLCYKSLALRLNHEKAIFKNPYLPFKSLYKCFKNINSNPDDLVNLYTYNHTIKTFDKEFDDILTQGNPSIPIDHFKSIKNYRSFSKRLTIRDLKRIDSKFEIFKHISWYDVTVNNSNITAEIIIETGYPWEIQLFPNPTISYYKKFKTSAILLSSSDRITIDDIINHPEIPWADFSDNPNITETEYHLLCTIPKYYNGPKDKPEYRRRNKLLYDSVIKELNYL